jgi:hypothetical protein
MCRVTAASSSTQISAAVMNRPQRNSSGLH